MSTKQIKGVIVPRHDTAKNWANAKNFIPRKGELIVYDADTDSYDTTVEINGQSYPVKSSTKVRFKFGDGELQDGVMVGTNVNALPFATAEADIPDTDYQEKFLEVSRSGNTINAIGAPYTVKLEVSELNGTAGQLKVDSGYVSIAGLSSITPTTLTGKQITVNGAIFSGLSAPIDGDDAVPRQYVDDGLDSKPGVKIAEKGEIFNNYTYNIASGIYAHAEGNRTEAIVEASHAEGYKAKASGAAAHAEGVLTEAKGTSSHTEGRETVALGYVAHAEGHKTEAIGHGSHTEGAVTKAISDNAHAEGVRTTAGTKGFKITNIEIDATTNTGTLFVIDGSNVVIPEQPDDIYDKPADYVTDKVTECYEIGDLLNIDVDRHQYGKYNITSLEDGKIHFAGIDSFNVANTTDELVLGSAAEDNYVWVANKHFGGTIDQFSGIHAEGSYTTAIGWGAHSEGRSTQAIGNYSHAEGRGTIANYGAHAEGRGTTAKGHMSHAEGQNTTTIGECAHAEGKNTIAKGYYSHAEGYATQANGNSSHASGDHTVAGYTNQFVTGVYNDNKTNSLFEVGYGLADKQRRNAFEVLDDGTANLAKQGSDATSVVIKSTLTDELNKKPGTKVSGGEKFNAASDASGSSSHAEGYKTNAIGEMSHAEGNSTTAYGPCSHAEGRDTVTGVKGTKVGTTAHAEGDRTVASNYCAHAEGFRTLAQHQYSHAAGYYTATGADYQTVVGRFNEGKNTTLFEVGCGSGRTPTSNREDATLKNAFEIDKNDDEICARVGGKTVCTASDNATGHSFPIHIVVTAAGGKAPDANPGTLWIQLM